MKFQTNILRTWNNVSDYFHVLHLKHKQYQSTSIHTFGCGKGRRGDEFKSMELGVEKKKRS